MYSRILVRSIVIALSVAAVLMVNTGHSADVAVDTDTTWSDTSGYQADDSIYVNGGATLDITGNLSSQAADSLLLGDSTVGTPGTGTLNLTSTGSFTTNSFTLGSASDAGTLNMAAGSVFTVNNAIELRNGTINNGNLLLDWSTQTITWTNSTAGEIIFNGTSDYAIHFASEGISGKKFTLENGDILVSGAMDANGAELAGGVLRVVNGELTLDGDLSTVGSTILLGPGGEWTLGATQDPTSNTIRVLGGTLTLGADVDYESQSGSFSLEETSSPSILNLNSYNLNLGDADNFTIEEGGHFITKNDVGDSTLSWNSGTVRAAYDTFMEGATETDYNETNINVALSGDAILEIYNSGSDPYTVTYDFSLVDTATVVGVNMTLYAQAEANITSTGTNTANFIFLGRNNKSANIENGIFQGTININNGVSNQIQGGTFNNTVTISNSGDTSAGQSIGPGIGLTTISGGTFNHYVYLDLDRIDDTDEQNKATITGGTFDKTVAFTGAGNANITGGTFDSLGLASTATGTFSIDSDIDIDGEDGVTILGGTLQIAAGQTLTLTDTGAEVGISGGTLTGAGTLDGKVNMTGGTLAGTVTYNDVVQFSGSGTAGITGGSLDSLELVSAATGTLSIDNNISIGGADGATIAGGTLDLTTGHTLTLTDAGAEMLISGGTLTGAGALGGNVNMTAGALAGGVTINGNITQTGGTISPGDTAGELGTITVNGDLGLMNATIDIRIDETSDLIDVNGAVTLQDGGVMTLTPDFTITPDQLGKTYTVIQTTDGIVDEGYSVDVGTAGFLAETAIFNDDYLVTIQRAIHTFPGARNANNVVNYLYDLYDEGDDQQEIMAALQSDPNQRIAAEKLSGEGHQTSLQALMNAGIMRLNTLNQQIRPTMNSRYFQGDLADNSERIARAQLFDPHAEFEQTRVWFTGYGMGGHIKGNVNTSSTIVSFAGMMVGIEGGYDAGSATVGLYYDGSGVETDETVLSSRTKVKTNYFGAYHTRELDNGYRLLTFGFGEDRYTSRRYLDIGAGTDAISELAEAGYHGWQSTLYAERGWDAWKSLFGLQPYLGLQYSYIRRNALHETASDTRQAYTDYAMLDMEAANYDSLRTYLGARWETPFFEIGHDRRTGMLLGGSFQFQSAWIHETLDKLAPINNAYLGASTLSNTFLVEGADCGRDWYLMSVGTRWRLTKTFSFYGDYSLLLNSQETLHTGSGGVCLAW